MEILDARENRVLRQKELLSQYQKPLLCFTMNIPGPVKKDRDIVIGFYVGCQLLRQALAGHILHCEGHMRFTGCEFFCVADMDAVALKKTAMELEDIAPIGRLFDMDVLTPDGQKFSREDLGIPRRKCLICEKDAYECASTRAHSLEALADRTGFLLYMAARQYYCEYIAVQAYNALIREVNVTPKPGLVDRNNSGAHKDMDIRHFFASANTLRPYFCTCAEEGYLTRDLPPEELLPRLRPKGMEAEKTMYQATFGANTHKGLIFSLGILCAIIGRLPPNEWTEANIQLLSKLICRGITRELEVAEPKTAGERLFAQLGITGVRGQAEAGFPAVFQTGLPILQEGLSRGLSQNDALAVTLLHLISATDDTNLISRGGRQVQLSQKQRLTDLLAEDPFPSMETIEALDREYIRDHLSPGGSADLLALTIFIHSLTRS